MIFRWVTTSPGTLSSCANTSAVTPNAPRLAKNMFIANELSGLSTKLLKSLRGLCGPSVTATSILIMSEPVLALTYSAFSTMARTTVPSGSGRIASSAFLRSEPHDTLLVTSDTCDLLLLGDVLAEDRGEHPGDVGVDNDVGQGALYALTGLDGRNQVLTDEQLHELITGRLAVRTRHLLT